jgi:hypothetical protein
MLFGHLLLFLFLLFLLLLFLLLLVMAKRRVGVEYSPSLLEPVRPGAVSSDRALYLPTFRRFVIVNKTSLSLSLFLFLLFHFLLLYSNDLMLHCVNIWPIFVTSPYVPRHVPNKWSKTIPRHAVSSLDLQVLQDLVYALRNQRAQVRIGK